MCPCACVSVSVNVIWTMNALFVVFVSRRYNQLYADGDEDDINLVEQVREEGGREKVLLPAAYIHDGHLLGWLSG